MPLGCATFTASGFVRLLWWLALIARTFSCRPEHVTAYKGLHSAVWDDVLTRIRSSGIRNYSIFYW